MSDTYRILPYQVRSAGTDVPPEEVQAAINSLAQQVTLALNSILALGPVGPAGGDLSGTYPNPQVTGLHVTSGSLSGVTGTTQGRSDNSTLLATDAFVNQQIISATANVPFPLTGGVYNQATLGNGLTVVIFVSGGVIGSILSVVSGGTGFAVGDLVLVPAGNSDAVLRITNVVGGVVQSGGVSVIYGGTGYTTGAQVTAVPVPPGQRTVTFIGVLTSNVIFIIQNGTFLTAARRVQFNNNTTGAFTVTVFLSNGIGGTTGSGVLLNQGTNNSTAVLVETDGMNDVWLADTAAGIGAATTAGTLAQFAATTSAQLAGVISDETGSGSLVFGTGPTLTNPVVGTQALHNNTTIAASTAYVQNELASPPAIGGTAQAAGSFTALNSTSGALNGTLGAATPSTVSATTIAASGTITPSQTNGIVGTTTNNNANAGSVGEYVTATGTAVSLTSGTPANVTSISLTAGDWDVWGNVVFNPGAATVTGSVLVGVSTTSATLPASPFFSALTTVSTVAAGSSGVAPQQRLSLSATTTVFLVTSQGFTGGTLTATGAIQARRRR